MKNTIAIVGVAMAMIPMSVMADTVANMVARLESVRTVCGGISDDISRVTGIAKANTAVNAVGAVAGGGALYAGIKKSSENQRIEELMAQINSAAGANGERVASMSDDQFLDDIITPMAEIAQIQESVLKSMKLTNWRTGLMIGGAATHVASAIMAGTNKNQSDLIQRITACNELVRDLSDARNQFQAAGENPMDHAWWGQVDNILSWCGNINTKDIEKIERRMKTVMGTGIGGAVVDIAGAGVSGATNTAKVALDFSQDGLRKKQNMDTAANVMAGVGTAASLTGTGFNVSILSLGKKLINQAQRCKEVLK